MPGTIAGGIKAARSNKKRYGENFYRVIGRDGGEKSRGGGFAKDPELAKVAGRKGGQATRLHWQKVTQCVHGHAYDEENTLYYMKNGRKTRYCKACRSIRYYRSLQTQRS